MNISFCKNFFCSIKVAVKFTYTCKHDHGAFKGRSVLNSNFAVWSSKREVLRYQRTLTRVAMVRIKCTTVVLKIYNLALTVFRAFYVVIAADSGVFQRKQLLESTDNLDGAWR